jgi:hypothetical protein
VNKTKKQWRFDSYMQQWIVSIGGADLTVMLDDDGGYEIDFCEDSETYSEYEEAEAKKTALEFAERRVRALCKAVGIRAEETQ